MSKIKLSSVTSVNFMVHIKCNNLSSLDYRYLQNCGFIPGVAAQFSLSTPYQAIKTSWLVVPVLSVTSPSGKIL